MGQSIKNVKIVRKYLKENDFEFVRRNKKEIWEHKDTGQKITVAITYNRPTQLIKNIKYKVNQMRRYQTQNSNLRGDRIC